MSLTLKLALSPLLVAQAVATRARLPRLPEAGGARRGEAGRGPLLRLLIAGDSSAAGVGVQSRLYNDDAGIQLAPSQNPHMRMPRTAGSAKQIR